MRRICVVCEGQTEEEFILQVLAPSLYTLGLNLVPEMIETSPGHRGGALSYERVRKHLRNTLRQNSAPVVTTLFDLYRLDSGFPGLAASRSLTDLSQRLAAVKNALHADIVAVAGCEPVRFIPYIQPHEFESLLFSDVEKLVASEPAWRSALPALSAARAAAASPEHINDHPDTKPAARLAGALSNPSYRKRRHGPVAAGRIGLPAMEAQCAFFADWLAQIRSLAPR